MRQPVQNLCDSRKLGPLRQNRAVDHQHGQAQRARRIQLGPRAGASRVLGDDKLRPMALHQRAIVGFGKGPSGNDNFGIRQGQAVGVIHQTQQIIVLGLGGKILKMHAANGQENPLCVPGQCIDSRRDIRDVMPVIAGLRRPRRAGQRGQGHLRCPTRLDRVPAHLGRKRMGCVHDMSDGVVADEIRQTFRAAVTANTDWQRLRAWRFHPSCVGIDSRNSLFHKGFSQGVGLGRTAQKQHIGDQEISHV